MYIKRNSTLNTDTPPNMYTHTTEPNEAVHESNINYQKTGESIPEPVT